MLKDDFFLHSRADAPDRVKTEEPWYALQVRSRREDVVAKILANKGYCVFLPTFDARRKQTDRKKTVRSPLFPGYVFCQFRLSERTVPVVTTPGVQRIVGTSSGPSPVSKAQLESVRSICNAGLPHGPYYPTDSGPTVRITEGPLAGVEGSLVTVNGHDTLVVTISLIHRSVSVQMPARHTSAGA